MTTSSAAAPFAHVVCAVESQELSAPAIAQAARAAAGDGQRLSLVHVVGTVARFTGGQTSRSRPPQELQAELVADARAWLDPLAAGHGAEAVTVVGPDPATTLLEWARDNGADLLVICPHRKGLARLLGSFAAEIVKDPPCAVLLAPHP
ncbi:MAG: universal stress protein [Miltoncostaeaceae bacterium]